MSQHRVQLVPVLLFVIAIMAAFLSYDRYTAQQRDAIAQRQREFEARTAAQVQQLGAQATAERQQSEAGARTNELELKKLELEIKRAEADRAQALTRQKELDVQQAAQQHSAQAAEEAAERARMDAETARVAARQDETRKRSAEVRAATLERQDAARRVNELAWKKQSAERLVIAWRNKLDAAQHSKAKAAVDLANAQAQPSRASTNALPQRRAYDPLGGYDSEQNDAAGPQNNRKSSGNGPTVTWITSNRDAVDAAQAQQAGAEHAIATAQAALTQAQAELTRLTAEYESAAGAKQSADRRLAQVAPPQPNPKAFATYALLDGRKLEAFCVIESGDDIWIKTGGGIEAIKRTDIEEIVRAEDAK